MKHRTLGILLGALSLGGLVPLIFSGVSCSQPSISCVVGHGPFYASYTLVNGTGSCAELKGDEIAFSTYLQPNADRSFADYEKKKIAVQSETLGLIFREAETNKIVDTATKPYGLGDYTTTPDSNNLCYAGGAGGTPPLSMAEQNIPAYKDADGNDVPARHIRQQWKNITSYVTADAPGTQIIGEMTYEDVIEGCSATYTFVGLYPAVPCGADTDNDPATPNVPDPLACSPTADPDAGRVFGSGINPDFATTCDPERLYCVLAGKPLPQL